MKKFSGFVCISAVLLALAACDDSSSSPSSENGGDAKKKSCIDKKQCDAIVRDDYSTWHYDEMRMSGDIVSYRYSVEGSDFFQYVDEKINESYFNNYDMTTQQSQNAAYNMVVETCQFKMNNPGTVFCDETENGKDANTKTADCIDKTQCDAMLKEDVSTWHFTRADAFGEPSEYVYSVADNGEDLIVRIDGKEKSYSMYNMSTEVGVEMAFSAAKASCEDGMAVEGAKYCE
jgi:hypothetical protein